MFDIDRLSAVTQTFQVLSHPVRLRIVEILAAGDGEVCVCDLEAALPVKQPTVSHHLRILRNAGLVGYRKEGQWAHYTVHRPALAALAERVDDWLRAIGAFEARLASGVRAEPEPRVESRASG